MRQSSVCILPVIIFFVCIAATTTLVSASSYEGDIGGRYSFSLTTFDPSGKLSQVSHATRASTLGPPIIALTHAKHSAILLCSPHALPSPLVRDDGTSRFTSISSSISLCHSGIGADGRVIVDASFKCAIEHLYTYDEEVPIDVFLETLSLLFQENTMKPGCRPFGCSVLVCYIPPAIPFPRELEDEEDLVAKQQPCIYRIDPSGGVELMVGGERNATPTKTGASIAFIGQNSAKIVQGITSDLQLNNDDDDTKNSKFYNANTLEEARELLLQSFRQHLGWENEENHDNESNSDEENDQNDKEEDDNLVKISNAMNYVPSAQPLLVASMTRKNGLIVKCSPSLSSSFSRQSQT